MAANNGGVITGYGNDTVMGNKVVNLSGVVQNNRGHAVYGGGVLENTVPANKALDCSQYGGGGVGAE